MSLLELHGVRFRHGSDPVLDVVNLAVEAGSTLAVVGPNGSGKTTLLMLCAQIWRPSEGEILFRGQVVKTRSDAMATRRQVAMVFDEPLLFDGPVHRNLAIGLKFRGMPRTEQKDRIADVLKRFRITHLYCRDTRELSLGEAQRVSLARAFVLRPTLLLLDEPFHTLDPISREALLSDLSDNLHASSITTLFTTHNMDEARLIADRMVILKKGRPVQHDTPAEILARPVNPEVASFVGMENQWSARVLQSQNGQILAEVGGVKIHAVGQASVDESVVLGLRPEHVTLVPPEVAKSGNAFPGTVVASSPRGACTRLKIHCGIPLVALALDGLPNAVAWRAGDGITATFPPEAVHIMRETSIDPNFQR